MEEEIPKIPTKDWRKAIPGDIIKLDGETAISDLADDNINNFTTLDTTGDPNYPQNIKIYFRDFDFVSRNIGEKSVEKDSCILLYDVIVIGDENDSNNYEYIAVKYEVI